MILFISDVHLGRGAADDRRVEQDLIACLDAHQDRTEHLYLLGDLFDEFIEYRHLVPKGYVRLLGRLAEWTDSGRPITYFVGNHDPWHRDYFESELGVRVRFESLSVRHFGQELYLAHGDRGTEKSVWKSWWNATLRHPLPVWLYRTVLPGDTGFGLARFVNRRFGRRDLDEDLIERLRVHARRILREHTADVVVFGHSHFPELLAWPEGIYLNAGYWHESRTFGRLDDRALQLVRWNGQESEVVEDQMLSSRQS